MTAIITAWLLCSLWALHREYDRNAGPMGNAAVILLCLVTGPVAVWASWDAGVERTEP